MCSADPPLPFSQVILNSLPPPSVKQAGRATEYLSTTQPTGVVLGGRTHTHTRTHTQLQTVQRLWPMRGLEAGGRPLTRPGAELNTRAPLCASQPGDPCRPSSIKSPPPLHTHTHTPFGAIHPCCCVPCTLYCIPCSAFVTSVCTLHLHSQFPAIYLNSPQFIAMSRNLAITNN